MEEKKYDKFHTVFLIFVFVIIFTIVCYCLYFFALGSSYFDNQARSLAQLYSRQTAESVQTRINDSFSGVKEIAAEVASFSDPDRMREFGESKRQQLGLFCLQFLKNGVPAYQYGDAVGHIGTDRLQDVMASGNFGNSGIYTDELAGVDCVAVYCPVYGGGETDGVVAYYAVTELFGENMELHELASYCCLSMPDGSIIDSVTSENLKADMGRNIFTSLYNLTESRSETNAVEQPAKSHESGVSLLHIGGNAYIATSVPISDLSGNCFVFQLFEVEQLLEGEHALSDSVFVFSAILATLSVVALLASMFLTRSDKKKLLDEIDIDPILGCNTYKRFVVDARNLMGQNRYARYAVINFDINKFQYLKDHLSAEKNEETLKYISTVCMQMTDGNETIGHIVDDSFVMLMHYTDVPELGERIKLLDALISNYSTSKELGMDIRLSFGVYLVEGDLRQDIHKMLDCAKIALQANKKYVGETYTVYNSAIASAYMQEAELEAKMGTALKNRDFKLFFQPKYSFANDCVESAEVLVRWYNPSTQTYIPPDSFIRVFEANGFISELDHYVFEETCRFLSDYTSHGERVVPLSVNVSLATAIKPDFLNFYIGKKKEYGVADGFITLEFTESFAAESYELLEHLLTVLKSNGFKGSIDDFGMGNSSLIAVKELPVDELKFDRILIKRGQDSSKDDALLKMLIDVSKELGLKVTQEGVETREDMERMRSLGCDVVQGYYYAKPMHIIDFVDFLKEDTSLAAVRRFRSS